MPKPLKFLLQFEAKLEVGPTKAARALGVAYPTYAGYRSGSRELPLYHIKHIHALMLHTPAVRKMLMEQEK